MLILETVSRTAPRFDSRNLFLSPGVRFSSESIVPPKFLRSVAIAEDRSLLSLIYSATGVPANGKKGSCYLFSYIPLEENHVSQS